MQGNVDIFDRHLLYSSAAALADIAPKSLHNWIDRKVLMFLDEIEDCRDGVRRYSIFDAIRLSITRHLVDFGVPVQLASLWAMAVFLDQANVAYIHSLSQNQIIKRLIDRTIYAWREGSDWRVAYSGKRPLKTPPSFLVIEVGKIVRQVFDRLDEMVE